MITRAITGFVFVSLLLFSILYSSTSFVFCFFIFMMIAVHEMSKMLVLKQKGIYFIAALLFVTNVESLSTNYDILFEAVLVLLIVFKFLQQLFSKNQNAIRELGNLFLALTYACLPFVFLVNIPFFMGSYQHSIIVGLFLLIWGNDTFAYLTGISIGKTKLYERISPKKTVEGFLGGTISTLIIAYALAHYLPILSNIHWMSMGLIVSVFGVLGDLIASMFKRIVKVKDTGNIIPGHGGIIDRLDSIIFAAPIVFVYLKIINTYVS
jgi:phosphatidate cytidylyltransferase